MSEYQYYEWLAVDRPLSDEELEEVSGLSSHMDVVTDTQAVVTYSFGDFKHDRHKVLLKYFDAMLYLANWGSRELMFRFPASAVDEEAISAYCIEDRISLTQEGKYQVLEIDLGEEEGGDWIEADGVLRRLAPLREEIIQGDYRALYLAWLKAKLYNERAGIDDESEPTVPPGLRKLTASLKTFMELFDIDPHLVKAAAETSDALQPVSDQDLASALVHLTRKECDAFLLRVLQNEAQVGRDLRKRLIELAGLEKPAARQRSPSPLALSEVAKGYKQEEQRREQAETERKRIMELEDLAKREEITWLSVVRLIEEKKAKPYDEAVALLVQLRALAAYQGRMSQFESRLNELAVQYSGRPGLIWRLNDAKLVK